MIKEEYSQIKNKIDELSNGLCNLVTSLVGLVGDTAGFPNAEVRQFLKAYESLYYFQKSSNMGF